MTGSGLQQSVVSLLAVTVLSVGLLALGVPAAQAATVDCPPMSSDVCKNLRPVAECVWENGNGTMTVLWGWTNPTGDTARIAGGAQNRISPGPNNQGQPTLFGPGTHRNVFVTTVSDDEAQWRLGNRTAEADEDDTQPCATKPVSQVGNTGALVIGGLVIAVGALVFLASRPRPMVVSS